MMTAKKGYTYPSQKVTRKRFVDIKDSSYSFAFFMFNNTLMERSFRLLRIYISVELRVVSIILMSIFICFSSQIAESC